MSRQIEAKDRLLRQRARARSYVVSNFPNLSTPEKKQKYQIEFKKISRAENAAEPETARIVAEQDKARKAFEQGYWQRVAASSTSPSSTFSELDVLLESIRHNNQSLRDPMMDTATLLATIKTWFTSRPAANCSITNAVTVLHGLGNLLHKCKEAAALTIGHYARLFALLDKPHSAEVQTAALAVIASTTGNADCVSDIARTEVVGRLLLAIHSNSLPESELIGHWIRILETLNSLFSNSQLVRQAYDNGAVVYLLDLFCSVETPGLREKTAEVLAKMVMDKLVGQKVRICVTKFLPTIFLDAMKTSPETAVSLLDSQHENPELIWNDDIRAKVARVVHDQCRKHYRDHQQNPSLHWTLGEDFALSLEDVTGEVVVAGVYLRLFAANPGWVLRRPKQFMIELLERMVGLMSGRDNQQIELVCESLVKLLEAQTALAEQLPTTGYIPRIFATMATIGEAGQKPAILLLHQISKSSVCVEAMSNCDCVAPLQKAMKLRKDLLSTTCETFNRMFSSNHDSLVSQALSCALIEDFLNILGARLDNIANPSACKAHVVQAIKAMQRSLVYGDQVSGQLSKSTVWAQDEKQNHDRNNEWPCPECDEKFSRGQLLQSHIKSVHEMQRHKQKIHGVPLPEGAEGQHSILGQLAGESGVSHRHPTTYEIPDYLDEEEISILESIDPSGDCGEPRTKALRFRPPTKRGRWDAASLEEAVEKGGGRVLVGSPLTLSKWEGERVQFDALKERPVRFCPPGLRGGPINYMDVNKRYGLCGLWNGGKERDMDPCIFGHLCSMCVGHLELAVEHGDLDLRQLSPISLKKLRHKRTDPLRCPRMSSQFADSINEKLTHKFLYSAGYTKESNRHYSDIN